MEQISKKIQDELICTDKIAESLELLRQRSDSLGNWDIKETLDSIEFSYCSMLDYMLQNYVSDTSANERRDIQRRLLSVNDQIDRLERLKLRKNDLYSKVLSSVRSGNTLGSVLEELLSVHKKSKDFIGGSEVRSGFSFGNMDRDNLECLRTELFNIVWTSDLWSNADYENANRFIYCSDDDGFNQCVFVSAVTLSLLEYFDSRKVDILFDAYLSTFNDVRVRAIVGIVLVLREYDMRISKRYPEIMTKLSALSNDERFVSDFYMVITQLQYSSVTDKVTTKMNSDILPTIMSGSGIRPDMSANELDDLIAKKGQNPEWTNFKKSQNAERKIDEMQKMSMEGADIHMSTFRHMKTYSFFNKVEHWFYPFKTNNNPIPEIDKLIKSSNGKIVRFLVDAPTFCDSDKYSFCLSLVGLNNYGGIGMSSDMEVHFREFGLGDLMDSDKGVSNEYSTMYVVRHYVFDLYRFFSLFKYSNQFLNPFEPLSGETKDEVFFMPIKLVTYSFLANNPDKMYSFGDFLMRMEWYEDADKIFAYVENDIEMTAEFYQKRGFCKEKTGDSLSAEEFYEKANILKPMSKWTLLHLAAIYKKSNRYKESVRCYTQLLSIEPDNKKVLYDLSYALFITGDYDKALEHLYKLYYMDECYMDVKEIIVKCLLRKNDVDKVAEMLMGSDNFRHSILSAFVFIRENNYVSAHEMLKISWEQWQSYEGVDKKSFEQEYDAAYDMFRGIVDANVSSMLYDATILR